MAEDRLASADGTTPGDIPPSAAAAQLHTDIDTLNADVVSSMDSNYPNPDRLAAQLA